MNEGNDAEPRRRTVVAERPHFLSIIASEADIDVRLKIPKNFIERYQIKLIHGVLLKVSSMAVWRVGIITDPVGDVWMASGWNKFTQFYSVQCGQYLFFRFEGGCTFHVTIVDNNTGMEIEYPVRDKVPGKIATRLGHLEPLWDYHNCCKDNENGQDSDGEKGDGNEGKVQPDADQQQGDDLQPKKDEGQENQPIPEVEMQPNTAEDQEDEPISEREIPPMTDEDQEEEPIPETEIPQVTYQVQAKALDRVSFFRSEHPYFVVFMQPSNVSRNYTLFLPEPFSKLYFKPVPETISLCISENRIWYFTCHGRRPSNLSISWDSFARDNDLEPGDVCVFELINRGDIPLLRVFISRDKEPKESAEKERPVGVIAPHEDELPAEELQKTKITTTNSLTVLEQAAALKWQNPTFIVVMETCYLNYLGLRVPKEFEDSYFMKSTMVKLSVPDGRTWFLKHSGKECYLSVSWFSFVKENNLKTGDVCAFELIQGGSIPELNVTVFPVKNPDANKKERFKRNAFELNEPPATMGIENNVTVEGVNKEEAKRKTLEMPETSATKVNEKKVTVEADNKEKPKCSTLGSIATPASKGKEKIVTEGDRKEKPKCSTLGSIQTPASKGKEKIVTEGDRKVIYTGESSASRTPKRKFLEMTPAMKSNRRKISAAYERASAYKSAYPFCVMQMRKTYLTVQYTLTLPARFARENFSVKPTNALLCLPDGRYWRVKWVCYDSTPDKHGLNWERFVVHNDVQEDDACTFELVANDGIEPWIRVTIFRMSENDQPPPPFSVWQVTDNGGQPPASTVRPGTVNGGQPSSSTVRQPSSSTVRPCTVNERQPAPTAVRQCASLESTYLERAKAFRSNLPYFIITVNSSYLFGGYGLYVPLSFSRQYFNNKDVKSVMLQVRDSPGKWGVNCSHISTREGVVYLGWRQFAVDNGVKLGDICVFELIDQINSDFEVVIFRAGA